MFLVDSFPYGHSGSQASSVFQPLPGSKSSAIELGKRTQNHSWEGFMGQTWKWHVSPLLSFSLLDIPSCKGGGKFNQSVHWEGGIHRFVEHVTNLPEWVTWLD